MNQNTSVDNDLQKAIDDITNSTNGDPLFADPVAVPAPAPRPVGPIPAPAPMPTMNPAVAAAPAPMPMPEPVQPAEPVSAPVEDIKPAPIVHEEEIEMVTEPEAPKAPFMENPTGLSINEVKEAALREVAPMLGELDLPAKKKFDLCKDVIDNYHDSSVIATAYRAASDISNDRERGEALLYIIDTIDNM